MPALDGLTSHGDVYDFGGAAEANRLNKPSRNIMGALSGKFMPTKYKSQIERGLRIVLMTAHSPFLKPFQFLNLFSNHIFGQFEGLVDSIYEKGYKLFPHKMIGQGIKAIKNSVNLGGANSGKSKHISDHWLLKKLNINIDDNLAEELIKIITKIYDPEYLKSVSPEFVNEHGKLVFFTKALKHGEHPYITLSEHILEEAMGELTKKAFGGASGAINNLDEEIHEDEVTQEETGAKLKKTGDNAANKASEVAIAAKNGVQNGVDKVTQGTKNISFGNNAKSPSKSKVKIGFLGQITENITGLGNSLTGLLKKLPIPGLGKGNPSAA